MSVTTKAIWYIESHLSDDVSLDATAASVGVWRFHLSRAFSATVELPLVAYARARRFTVTAQALVQDAPDILAVALDAGYGSHEAFTRAFRQQFGLTPEQLRAQANFDNITLLEAIRMDRAAITPFAAPRIVERDALLIFGVGERCRSNAGIPAQWGRFVPHWGHIQGQVGRVTYGVIRNLDEAGTHEYICGVELSEFPAHPPEFSRLRIPRQTYAVFAHREHIAGIGNTWKTIWNQALPASGYQAADAPSFRALW